MPVKGTGSADGRGRQRIESLSVSIIGAGRLGGALALALTARGYRIEALVARNLRHARRAARLLGTQTLALAASQLNELPPSDILFITTPDDQVATVAAQLAATVCQDQGSKSRVAEGKGKRTALHASGALSSAALGCLNDAGFATGSMHPLVSVSDSVQGAKSLAAAYFCVEGSTRAVRVARGLVRALGAESFSIKAEDKALYHAAAVMASGHTTALFDISMEMLARCGLTRNRARAVLLPLLRSTLENLDKSAPARALTGTFARADTETVRRHLEALSSQAMPEALAAYTLLGKRSLQLAKSAGARPAALKEIEKALKAREG